jgi:hypothetical protein
MAQKKDEEKHVWALVASCSDGRYFVAFITDVPANVGKEEIAKKLAFVFVNENALTWTYQLIPLTPEIVTLQILYDLGKGERITWDVLCESIVWLEKLQQEGDRNGAKET